MLPALLLLIPLIGGLAVILAPARLAKWIALLATTVVFVYSIGVAVVFGEWGTGNFGLTASWPILPEYGVNLQLGGDSVSMLLVLLTTLLMPLCVWGSFTGIQHRLKEYYGWLLVLEAAMIGVFIATDLVFFYVCFELTLVPMYFLIGIYGGGNRVFAAIKFFVYTFTGSLLTLAGVIYIAWRFAAVNGGEFSFDIQALTQFAMTGLSASEQAWVLLALMAGFAVKVPLFPVHTWLPLAHTEAPTAGSVILAGVLLKLGTYGLYRFVLPMVPLGLTTETSFLWFDFIPLKFIAVLSIVGILYAALICWVQNDIKKLIAYSSVSHLGFCVLGLFALNSLGAQGSVLYMINHGLSTGALFFLVGMMYERYHTRDMNSMSGLSKRMPVWAFFMVFFVLASVGLPGLNGFVSEFLCLIGAFSATADAEMYPGMLGPWYAAWAGLGMILAAMYLLIMVGKVVWGPLREPVDHDHDDDDEQPRLPPDLSIREIAVLTPLAIGCLYIGLQPAVLTDAMEGSIQKTLAAYPAIIEQMQVAEDDKQTLSPRESVAAQPPGEGKTTADGHLQVSVVHNIGRTVTFPLTPTPLPGGEGLSEFPPTPWGVGLLDLTQTRWEEGLSEGRSHD